MPFSRPSRHLLTCTWCSEPVKGSCGQTKDVEMAQASHEPARLEVRQTPQKALCAGRGRAGGAGQVAAARL